MITDLAHSAFRVHDLEKSLAFYELLGLKESFRLNHDDGSVMLVYLHIGADRFLELFPSGPLENPQNSFMHICLASDSLVEDVEMLRSKGVKIDIEPKMGLDLNMQAWISDPDGNPIELMQLSELSPQRQVARGEVVTFKQ
jgi:lactoylglutathione lyase